MNDYIIKKCSNAQVESLIEVWNKNIIALADKMQIPCKDLEKQIRLHLPFLYSDEDLKVINVNFPEYLETLLDERFVGFQQLYSNYLIKSGGVSLQDKTSEIKGESIFIDNQHFSDIQILAVDESIGQMIESKLHYLRLMRADCIARYGIFLKTHKLPICYMSFSLNDRKYRLNVLEEALGETLEAKKIVQLTRVYGFGNLPRNTISKLVSFCSNELKSTGVDFIITAINPFIGFNGSSMLAAGFKPFAFCPVAYNYNTNGQYIGRRLNGEYPREARMETPPNLLLVRGISRKAQKLTLYIDYVKQVSVDSFNAMNKI